MLLVRALEGMAAQITFDKFYAESGISSKPVAKDVVEYLLARGIGRVSNTTLYFSGLDRAETAVLAICSGCDPENVSSCLSWKDFEVLASHVLTSLGYRTRVNVRFTKPRMEIDVVGVDGNFAIALDCKHWKKNNLSAITVHCDKQVKRVHELIRREPEVIHAVPAVLTLHTERTMFAHGVPVVPVSKLGSFLADVRNFLPEICVVMKRGSA